MQDVSPLSVITRIDCNGKELSLGIFTRDNSWFTGCGI